jgi:hypothetical protein
MGFPSSHPADVHLSLSRHAIEDFSMNEMSVGTESEPSTAILVYAASQPKMTALPTSKNDHHLEKCRKVATTPLL